MTAARRPAAPALPVVLLPVGADDDALDACLAALDAGTPAGTRVWLADDAQAGPRGLAIIERWLARTALAADYSRRQRAVGEVGPVPVDPARLARACGALPPVHPELPAAVAHAVALRARARQRVGGLDASSFGSWYAALVDLSLRLAGLGWRNVLCETAFVARGGEGAPADGDLDALAVRWPGWHARLAGFLMDDPLHALRGSLGQLLAVPDPASPQRELFA